MGVLRRRVFSRHAPLGRAASSGSGCATRFANVRLRLYLGPMLIYRLLSGPDNSAFCHRVTEALSRGWDLHGGPAVTFDPERKTPIVAQAITKDVGLDYSADLDFTAL